MKRNVQDMADTLGLTRLTLVMSRIPQTQMYPCDFIASFTKQQRGDSRIYSST